MRKILVILAIFFGFLSVSAQTYEEQKEKNKKEQARLGQELEKITARIYYLENEVSEIDPNRKGIVYNNKQVKRDQKMKDKELPSLQARKEFLEKTLAKLESSYYALIEKDLARPSNDLELGPVEYKRLSRGQIYRASEGLLAPQCSSGGSSDSSPYPKKYKGIVRNYKRGIGELATFNIYRVDIKNTPPVSLTLNPNERVLWELLPGEYISKISCGSWCQEYRFKVDPRAIKRFETDTVYWATYKSLSDY